MMTHEELNAYMKGAADALEGTLPPNTGFILLAFEFGDSEAMAYIAKCHRQDAIATMKEWVEVMEKESKLQLPAIFAGRGKGQ